MMLAYSKVGLTKVVKALYKNFLSREVKHLSIKAARYLAVQQILFIDEQKINQKRIKFQDQ